MVVSGGGGSVRVFSLSVRLGLGLASARSHHVFALA